MSSRPPSNGPQPPGPPPTQTAVVHTLPATSRLGGRNLAGPDRLAGLQRFRLRAEAALFTKSASIIAAGIVIVASFTAIVLHHVHP